MQPERILVVSHCMDRNGAESLIMNIYRNLDREKVQFDFLLHCDYRSAFEDEIEQLGGRIYKVQPYKILNHFSYVRELDRFFKDHPEYRIVHGHLFNRIEYLKVAKKHGLTTIAHCHASTNGTGLSARIADFLHRNINKYADYKFACSEQAGEWLYGKGVDFKVIPNGIDTSRYEYTPEKRAKARAEFGIKEGTVLLGHVGRFHPVKNHAFILEVFNEYHRANPDSALMLVGEGELQEKTESMTRTMGIADCVIFTGSRADVPDLLCAMDCFIFPSLNEGLPVTLVEAQSAGLPCILPDHITDEVEVTDLFTRLSLSDGAKNWAERIRTTDSKNRATYCNVVKKSGFDIEKTASELQGFYLGL